MTRLLIQSLVLVGRAGTLTDSKSAALRARPTDAVIISNDGSKYLVMTRIRRTKAAPP